MSWFRIDDGFWGHEKVTGLSDCALALWLLAGSWTARYRKDGAVPRDIWKRLGRKQRAVRELIDAGLWVETSDGYAFHDFEYWQKHITKQDETREAAAERQRKSRMSRVTSNERHEDGEQTITRDPVTPSLPDPTHPMPDPLPAQVREPSADPLASLGGEAAHALDGACALVKREFAERFHQAEGSLWTRSGDPAVTTLAAWLLSVPGDAQAALQRTLDAFFADPWVKSQHFDVRHLARYPQKYFDPRQAPSTTRQRANPEERLAELRAHYDLLQGNLTNARIDGSAEREAAVTRELDAVRAEMRALKNRGEASRNGAVT